MDAIGERNKAGTPATQLLSAGTVFAVGAEVDRQTACLMEPISGSYRLAAWWVAPSGLQRTVAEQIEDLCVRLGKRLRRQLWDYDRAAPYTQTADPVTAPPLQHVSVVASPRRHLRIWVVGLTPHNSLASSIGALEASQAEVVGTTVLESRQDVELLAHELNATRPEALVLAGGYDSEVRETQRSIYRMTQNVARALQAIPEDDLPEIIFAGNPFAYRDVAAILRSALPCTISRVNNVQPAPDRTYGHGLSQAADKLYLRKCRQMREFSRLEEWTTDSAPIMTIESSFARLVQLWLQLNELPELHGVYSGGDRWLHVWADADADRVLARFAAPGPLPDDGISWPPIRLVSGPWQADEEIPSSVLWWDVIGLAPVAAAAAAVAPRAAVETLRADILTYRE
ncbi:MAG: glutamate mutase L [Caldilineaceae bacterium]